jgi:hypothetical protein
MGETFLSHINIIKDDGVYFVYQSEWSGITFQKNYVLDEYKDNNWDVFELISSYDNTPIFYVEPEIRTLLLCKTNNEFFFEELPQP